MERITWDYFLYTLNSLGPAFVKLAQWAATRRDLFPPYICDRLGKLHDKGPTHSWKETHQILVETFGENYHHHLRIHEKSEIIGSRKCEA